MRAFDARRLGAADTTTCAVEMATATPSQATAVSAQPVSAPRRRWPTRWPARFCGEQDGSLVPMSAIANCGRWLHACARV